MEKDKGGQPSVASRYGEPTKKTIVTLTESQRDHLSAKYKKVATGVRAVVDADMKLSKSVITHDEMHALIDLHRRAIAHGLNLDALLSSAIEAKSASSVSESEK